jgi:hypothetical protein
MMSKLRAHHADHAYADIVAALTLAKEFLRERARRIDEQ